MVVRCPGCESNDVREGESGYVCLGCGREFVARVKVVVYVTPVAGGAVCPECGYGPMRVVSSPAAEGRRRYRRHRCKCGWVGESLERVK